MRTVIKSGFLITVLKESPHSHTTQNDNVLASEKFILFDVPYVGKRFVNFIKSYLG